MILGMKTMDSVQNWDLIITNGGVAILVVPGFVDAGAILACADGTIVLGPTGYVHLAGSADATGFLRRKKNVLVASVDRTGLRERIVPVRIISRNIIAGAEHAAAA